MRMLFLFLLLNLLLLSCKNNYNNKKIAHFQSKDSVLVNYAKDQTKNYDENSKYFFGIGFRCSTSKMLTICNYNTGTKLEIGDTVCFFGSTSSFRYVVQQSLEINEFVESSEDFYCSNSCYFSKFYNIAKGIDSLGHINSNIICGTNVFGENNELVFSYNNDLIYELICDENIIKQKFEGYSDEIQSNLKEGVKINLFAQKILYDNDEVFFKFNSLISIGDRLFVLITEFDQWNTTSLLEINRANFRRIFSYDII